MQGGPRAGYHHTPQFISDFQALINPFFSLLSLTTNLQLKMTNNTPTSKSLQILLWNANDIHNHTANLSLILHEKCIDIAFISETNRTKIHIPDYKILRSNHPDGRYRARRGSNNNQIHNSLSQRLSTKRTP